MAELTRSAGIIGLGAMGMGMAKNILAAHIPLTGYDVSAQVCGAFSQAGGRVAHSAAEAANGADVLVVMVVNAAQARAALLEGGAVAALPSGAVVLVCATIAPSEMRALANDLPRKDVSLLDAPVSGGKAGADAGTLTIMASGTAAAMEKARPVLEACGSAIHHLGDAPGIGSTYKVVHQLAAGVHLVAAAELMALGAKAGCEPQKLFEIVSSAAGQSWMFNDRAPRMIEGNFQPPHSAVDIFVKDLGLALQAGSDHRMPLPLAAAAHQMLLAASSMGCGTWDDSAVLRAYQALGDAA